MLHLKYNSLVSPYALVFGEHFYKGMIRGFAEVCLGVYCYEVWLGINQIDFNRLGSFLLSSIEVLSFSAILYVIIFSHSPEYNIIGLMCVMFTIIIAFTGKTFCNSLFSSQVFFYLGKLSLSIYLSHKVIIYILSKYYDEVSFHLSNIQILLITTVPTIILGVVVNKLSCLVEKLQISRFFVQAD